MKQLIIIVLSVLLFACEKNDPVAPNNNASSLSDTTLVDVPYGSDTRQQYDIHLPAGRDSTTPVVLMIHGGGWQAGKKEDINNYVNLIKSNWNSVAIVNMNYRLASNANGIHHDEIMSDIEDVINDVIDPQNNYQVGSNMGIMGVSAGGQLAMIYAYRYDSLDNINCVANIFGPSIISDWSWYSSPNPWLGGNVGDVLSTYVGQPWDTTVYNSVSPYWNITATSQPMIIFHGNVDVIVPVYQSQWMHGKLNANGITNEYHEYFAGHSFNTSQNQDAVSKMVTFFQNHINN